MQTRENEQGVGGFIRWCLEKGNTPVWESKDTKRKRRRAQHQQRRKEPFALEGKLQVVAGQYSVNGKVFEVSDATWIIGLLESGLSATVKGIEYPDGRKLATKVTTK